MPRPRAILLMGPTGAGKTDLAAALVAQFPLEIVSVDSAMVYRGMDIGTAKPAPERLARAPHHLIDLIDPSQSYSAARFIGDALSVMGEIATRGHVPLLVGGTMLYFRALQSGLARLPAADPALRRDLDQRAAREGWEALHAELARKDPQAAERIRPGDRQRIQRALEVIAITGGPISSRQRENLRGATVASDLRLVLAPADRAAHAARLAERFGDMMRRGLLDEVRALFARGDLNAGMPSLRLIGYRQLWAHLEGRCTEFEATAQAVVATRQYARRQLTWLRAEPQVAWLDADRAATPTEAAESIENWLKSA
ncbi:MAG: tRNA (adenosine(37)-N6)-dimethylallyltransferase MiaA [Gammaproteobacteria bacterium]